MEKCCQVSRRCVDARDIRSLPGVAMQTRKSQVGWLRFTIVLAGDDVIDLERHWIEVGGQSTIFAAVQGTLPYKMHQFPRHWGLRGSEPKNLRACDCMTASKLLT